MQVLNFDALIDQTIDYNADVPEYVTEKGFSVSDNVSLKPEELSMTLYVTDTPVTWKYISVIQKEGPRR